MSNLAEKIWRKGARAEQREGATVRRIDRERDSGAEALRREGVSFVMGTIVAKEGASLTVRTGEDDVAAARATSCLLDPEVGDRVLVAGQEGERYVLSVLAREAGAAARVSVGGDLELCAPEGKVSVVAKEGIEMATAKEASVVSRSFLLRAAEGSVLVEKLGVLGSAVLAEVSKIKVVAEQCDSLLERAYQRVKRSYRFVEEIDQVRAKQIDMTAKDVVRVHAENAVVTANEVVKLDGEQVHIG